MVVNGWIEESMNFPISFQKEIISSLLSNKKMFINIGLMLSPKCFDTTDLQIFYKNIIDYFNKYNDLPTYETSLQLNENINKEVIDDIYGTSILSPATVQHVENTVKNFIQCQSLKKAILESIDNLGNIEKHNEIKNKIAKNSFKKSRTIST